MLSPSSPFVVCLGVLFFELLNLTFPRPPSPPFAITNSSLFFSKSTTFSFKDSLKITVPGGTSIYKSSPSAPVLLLFPPLLPDSEIKDFSYLNFARVLSPSLVLKMMSPPLPPSPPSGPPLGRFFALKKLSKPSPPFPAETSIKTSSMKFIET